ncbi:putative hydroquinone glucosyltransferase [Lupinus albus]|uniref:Putative hydroquinone glucosyltransferase n=1 Tax=Lupinus albus TaxID=3870 RepID=A0A6A4QW72_LUPAL|nr:putative hydroquinone glucosyltransferase [Lupinus albus]
MPGCVPLLGQDLPAPTQNRSSDAYKSFVERSNGITMADGIILNSFLEMEPDTIRALEEKLNGKTSFYPLGPITQKGSTIEENGSECLRWLENQPPSSVLYVSFGSGGTLTQDQVNELALGLELSGQKFLWVLRAPSNSTSAAYLGSQNENPLKYLPNGFLERTKDKGLVVASWAPQIQVLGHNSIGGFLSHCGWNSILESIQEGVPIITWPLFAEQRMNAVLLNNGLKVALRPKVNEYGIVEKEEIAKVIKCLMEGVEGKEIRKRINGLKDDAVNAIKEDGSSTCTMSKLATKWGRFCGI